MQDINPGIRKTVQWLQEHGFHTTDSGDGVTNLAAGMLCALPFPHVYMTCEPRELHSESHRLLNLLVQQGLNPEATSTLPEDPEQECPAWAVEASYNPQAPDIGVLLLRDVDDDLLFKSA